MEKAFTLLSDTWHTWTIELEGDSIEVYIDGNLELSHTDTNITSGRIAVHTDNATGRFDDIVVR